MSSTWQVLRANGTNVDLYVRQGSTLSFTVTIRAGNWSAWTGSAKLRSTFGAVAAYATLTVSAGVFDGTDTTFTVTAAATTTASLSAGSGNDSTREVKVGFWDFEIASGGTVQRILEGEAWLSQEATK